MLCLRHILSSNTGSVGSNPIRGPLYRHVLIRRLKMRQALVLRIKCLDVLFCSSTQKSRANVNQVTTTSSAASSLMDWRDLPRDNELQVTPTAINLDCRQPCNVPVGTLAQFNQFFHKFSDTAIFMMGNFSSQIPGSSLQCVMCEFAQQTESEDSMLPQIAGTHLQTTRYLSPEEERMNLHCHKNLIPHIIMLLYFKIPRGFISFSRYIINKLNLQAPCVLCIGQAFTTPQRTLFIYLINKYISLSDTCFVVHH